jgi:hypothetical protein
VPFDPSAQICDVVREEVVELAALQVIQQNDFLEMVQRMAVETETAQRDPPIDLR